MNVVVGVVVVSGGISWAVPGRPPTGLASFVILVGLYSGLWKGPTGI